MVATIAQAIPATNGYCSPGLSTNTTIAVSIVPIYTDPVETELIAASTGNPNGGGMPTARFYERWAFLILAAAAKTATLNETLTLSSGSTPSRLASKFRILNETATLTATTVTRLSAKNRALATETLTLAPATLTRIKGAVKNRWRRVI